MKIVSFAINLYQIKTSIFKMKLFLSCEHGGNNVPPNYMDLFKDAGEMLNTHRGFDKGALPLFKILAELEEIEFSIYSETTRLLVDLNRSLFRPTLFSEFTKGLDENRRKEILKHYYFPYRNAFHEQITKVINGGDSVFHLSIHAFTPEIDGIVRNADIGLLFDPAHGIEKKVAVVWRRILQEIFPSLVIRFNYPFMGKPDGHVAPLRREFGRKYIGFEFELNSKYAGNQEIYNGIVISFNKLIKIIR